ncbi:hypothetical protein [Pasteuria penetrans]|nr:hypothetical protein [Pasteuria penetrans]
MEKPFENASNGTIHVETEVWAGTSGEVAKDDHLRSELHAVYKMEKT